MSTVYTYSRAVTRVIFLDTYLCLHIGLFLLVPHTEMAAINQALRLGLGKLADLLLPVLR